MWMYMTQHFTLPIKVKSGFLSDRIGTTTLSNTLCTLSHILQERKQITKGLVWLTPRENPSPRSYCHRHDQWDLGWPVSKASKSPKLNFLVTIEGSFEKSWVASFKIGSSAFWLSPQVKTRQREEHPMADFGLAQVTRFFRLSQIGCLIATF